MVPVHPFGTRYIVTIGRANVPPLAVPLTVILAAFATAVNLNQTSLFVESQQLDGPNPLAPALTFVYSVLPEQKSLGSEIVNAFWQSTLEGCAYRIKEVPIKLSSNTIRLMITDCKY